jgi:hypothetical protein
MSKNAVLNNKSHPHTFLTSLLLFGALAVEVIQIVAEHAVAYQFTYPIVRFHELFRKL